jgi:hypothetical protein
MTELQAWVVAGAAVLGALATTLRAVVALITYLRERR